MRAGEAPAGGRAAEAVGWVVAVATLLLLGDVLAALFGLRGILATELLIVLLPAIVYALGADLDLRAAFALERPRAALLGAALLIAAGMSALGTAFLRVQATLVPIPAGEREAWATLTEEAAAAPALAVLALAVAPAVAEEALFRGVLLHRLRREVGAGRAVLYAGLLFGLFHRSGYRFVAQTALGLFLGWLVVRGGSLLPAVLGHLSYNLAVLMLGGWLYRPSVGVLAAAACGLLLTGILLARNGHRIEFT